MAVVVFDNNTSVIFKGSGVDGAMKTGAGATEYYIPKASGIKEATIIFLSHPVIKINPTYTLDKSVKDPVQFDHPYGIEVGITSQNEAAHDECVVVFHIN